jgi:hypothetical protein
MARVAKLLRAMPELVIMIKALKAAMRSVFFTLILLSILLYVFGILFTQLCADAEISVWFPSVFGSMYYLLLWGVLCLDRLEEISAELFEVGFYMPPFLFLFVLLSALTVMNMLIGVLCEVVNNVAKTESEINLIETTRSTVMRVLESIDEDGNQMISKDEFLHILTNPRACKAFYSIGIDVVGLVDFANTIFWDAVSQTEEELSFEDFMERILKLRDSNKATVKDVLNLAKLLHATDVRITHLHELLDPTGMYPSPRIAQWNKEAGKVKILDELATVESPSP